MAFYLFGKCYLVWQDTLRHSATLLHKYKQDFDRAFEPCSSKPNNSLYTHDWNSKRGSIKYFYRQLLRI